VRDEGRYDTKVVQTVYGVDSQGNRDVLGLYVEAHEGARNWGLVLEDLKRRGVEDVLFFCVDGLKGFKEVIAEVYPQSIVQRCVVHMVRSSTRFVKDKDIKAVCADLRKIYTSATEAQALNALAAFKEKWDKAYKEIAQKWEEAWSELMAFMAFKSDIRRMIYTTNPVEALHRVMRKVTKAKGAWTDEKALTKQLFLALTTNEKSWKRQAFNWKTVQKELIEQFGERFSKWVDS
jgi:transposase-like protein